MTEPSAPHDGRALAAFLDRRDERSFETIVERHGGMVLRVCYQVLGQTQDAEDAAQAVFLILARKAPTLRDRPSAGPWLHRVAHDIAINARRQRAARTALERKATNMETPRRHTSEGVLELHDELARLPRRYHQALVLFHLENRSLEETAAALRCPENTAKSWLARGRELLRVRLARRGVVLSLGGLLALLSVESKTAGAAEVSSSFVSAISIAQNVPSRRGNLKSEPWNQTGAHQPLEGRRAP